jgi:hypothetical protein
MSELTRKGLLAGGVAGAAALATAPGAQAHGERGSDDIVGSWYATITATDPPLGSFVSLMSWHEGAVFTESRRYYIPETPLGPLLETSGHGAWKRTGARSYAAFFRFLLQQAPPSAGAPLGTDNIRLAVRLDRGGDAYAGTFESNIRDLNGAVVFTARGTVSAERIVV